MPASLFGMEHLKTGKTPLIYNSIFKISSKDLILEKQDIQFGNGDSIPRIGTQNRY